MRSIAVYEIIIKLPTTIKYLIGIEHGAVDGIEKAMVKIFVSII